MPALLNLVDQLLNLVLVSDEHVSLQFQEEELGLLLRAFPSVHLHLLLKLDNLLFLGHRYRFVVPEHVAKQLFF